MPKTTGARPPEVSVTIVTYNSARYISRCLESVLAQQGVRFEIIVVDNASADGTRELLQSFAPRVRVLSNSRNTGFAAGQNRAIAAASGDWVLALNPDTVLLPGFIRMLVDAGEADPLVGSVCGRLLSIGADLQPPREPRIDSTGIYFTPEMRHFDRGWHEPDRGQFGDLEYVFGASAAAALYRREMIADVAGSGEFFDPDFFSYREDADVAWRAQWLGWRCLYVPGAAAYHVRSVTPANRRSVPAVLNMHSVKNRILMRVKNITGGLYRRYWLPMTLRDLVVVGGCVLREPRSLAAFWHAARCLPQCWNRRRELMRRRRVSDHELARWFNSCPAAEPAPEPAVNQAFARPGFRTT